MKNMRHVVKALNVVSNGAIPMHSVMDSQHRALKSIFIIPRAYILNPMGLLFVKMSDKIETAETHHHVSDYGLQFH